MARIQPHAKSLARRRFLQAVGAWQRDTNNPILRPGDSFDVGWCMNPFALRRGDEYWLFYAGADKQGHRRICLATAPVDRPNNRTPRGPLLDLGEKGLRRAVWCVLPCVHRVAGRWHLYYTGRSRQQDAGLQAFWGIGLAVSDDLISWKKVSAEPILRGDGFADWPKNRGIGGGGRILEIPQKDRRILYRMHYTLATGTPSKDQRVDQAKQSVIAHSYNGSTWTDRQVVLRPRSEADYENAATIALNVWRTRTRWRAIFAGIGTRFGAYSICEAVSVDGLRWERGQPGDNLALAPAGNGWESRMTTYPNVVEEEGQLRLIGRLQFTWRLRRPCRLVAPGRDNRSSIIAVPVCAYTRSCNTFGRRLVHGRSPF